MKKSNNGNGLTAIYARRCVSDSYKGNNSLSNENSGKGVTHYLGFTKMVTDVRNGEIKRIMVKKYARFSRNLRGYLNVSNEPDI